MADSVIIQIADAVVDAINAATLDYTVTAARAYVPVADVKDLTTLRVTVVPRDLAAAADTRHTDLFTYNVDVAVQKVLPADVSAIDPYMRLVEQIADVFRGKALAGYTDATCTAIANAPIYDPGHMDEKRVFTSVITLTFVVRRDRT